MISVDLVTWAEATEVFGAAGDNGDGTESVTIRDSSPVTANPRRFMRLGVVAP